MGFCELCGRKAGFWSWQHPECAARRAAGWSAMVDMVAEAVLWPRKRSKLSNRLTAVASSSFLGHVSLRTFYALGWDKAAGVILAARSPDDDGDRPQIVAEDELVTPGEFMTLFSFADRFGLGPEDLDIGGARTRVIQSVVIRNVLDGTFPRASDPADELPVVLQRGESLIWRLWNTEYAEIRPCAFYAGSSNGFSIRLGKGLYYRHNQFKGHPVTVSGPQMMGTGILYVTDRNLYFFSFNKTVRISYDKVISLLPLQDGFAIYTDGRTAKPRLFCTGDGWFACNLVANLIWQRRDGARRQPLTLPAPAAPRRTPPEIEQRAPANEADAHAQLPATTGARKAADGRRTTMYSPLRDYLEARPGGYVTLSFDDVAKILGLPLPLSARRHNAWWANTPSHSHASAWMDAGWRTEDLSLTAERVTFVRA